MSLDFEVFNSKHERYLRRNLRNIHRPVRRHPTKKGDGDRLQRYEKFLQPDTICRKKYTFALAVSDSQYAMNQKKIYPILC